jgi:hypothetical protein
VLAVARPFEMDHLWDRIDLERGQGGAQGIGELVADQRRSPS